MSVTLSLINNNILAINACLECISGIETCLGMMEHQEFEELWLNLIRIQEMEIERYKNYSKRDYKEKLYKADRNAVSEMKKMTGAKIYPYNHMDWEQDFSAEEIKKKLSFTLAQLAHCCKAENIDFIDIVGTCINNVLNILNAIEEMGESGGVELSDVEIYGTAEMMGSLPVTDSPEEEPAVIYGTPSDFGWDD